jgi:hypothetical protein
MATVSKVLAQGVMGTVEASPTGLGTVPVGHTYQITHVHIFNVTNITARFTACGASDFQYWFNLMPVGPKSAFDWYPRDLVTAAGGFSMELWADTAAALSFIVMGKDIT